jgi:outer membrane protein assembly factor BamB
MAGKKVFICAAPEDATYTEAVVAALDAWEVQHTLLDTALGTSSGLPSATEHAIRDCEVFLRLCTANTRRSSAVNLATDTFQQLLKADRKRGRRDRRKLVNLMLDSAYQLDADERMTLYIITEGKSRALWLEELAVPLGVATLAQRVSRRALLGMGIGAVLTVASASAAGVLVYQQRPEEVLPVRERISGQLKYAFALEDLGTSTNTQFDYALVLQDGNTVYAQTDVGIFVLSPQDKKQRRLPIDAFSGVQAKLVAAAQGTLFLYYNRFGINFPRLPPKDASEIRVVRASDGEHLWSANCFTAGTPTLADGVVYCLIGPETSRTDSSIYYDLTLHALNAHDGALLWRHDLAADTRITPAVVGGRVFLGSTDHRLYCLDAKTGATRWSYLTRGPVLGTPVVAGGVVYVGSEDGVIYALDASSGALRWRFATGDGVVAAPVVRDGVLYVGSADAYLYALDARSGALFWRAFAGVNELIDDVALHAVRNTAVVYRNVIATTVGAVLYGFDTRDGYLRWNFIGSTADVSSSPSSPPVLQDGLILFGASDQTVYVVNP